MKERGGQGQERVRRKKERGREMERKDGAEKRPREG